MFPRQTDWQTFDEIARRFEHKARHQDREDLRQDIIVRFAEVASKTGQQLTLPAMLRIASYCCQEYWRKLKRTQIEVCVFNGTSRPKKPDHTNCSLSHKPDSCRQCAYMALRPMLSLNYELEDTDGEPTELWQTIADDKAIDLEAWLDAKTWLLGCPRRLLLVALKRIAGKPLDNKDKCYWRRQREKELKKYQLALQK